MISGRAGASPIHDAIRSDSDILRAASFRIFGWKYEAHVVNVEGLPRTFMYEPSFSTRMRLLTGFASEKALRNKRKPSLPRNVTRMMMMPSRYCPPPSGTYCPDLGSTAAPSRPIA